MKNLVLVLILAIMVLALPGNGICAEAQANVNVNRVGNPVDQFTGHYWQKSTLVNKEAYLFGIESAIAVEVFIARERAKKGDKNIRLLSNFEKGWMDAFKDTPRKQIAEAVDTWYDAHPNELDKSVLSVLWYDVIVPRLQNQAGK